MIGSLLLERRSLVFVQEEMYQSYLHGIEEVGEMKFYTYIYVYVSMSMYLCHWYEHVSEILHMTTIDMCMDRQLPTSSVNTDWLPTLQIDIKYVGIAAIESCVVFLF